MISRKARSAPHVKWGHPDGPLMTLSDGRPHWLTWRERIALWLGWTTVERVNRRPLVGQQRAGGAEVAAGLVGEDRGDVASR